LFFLFVFSIGALPVDSHAQGTTFPCNGQGMLLVDNVCGTSTNGVFTPLSPADYTAYYQTHSIAQTTTPNCTGEGEGYVDGVCRFLRASVDATPMFVPQRIKIGSGSSAYYLDPTTQYSNWQNCKTGIGTQDSTCVVPC
jgi:hypothetical protein